MSTAAGQAAVVIASGDPLCELAAVTTFVVPDEARGMTARVVAAGPSLAEAPCAATSPAR